TSMIDPEGLCQNQPNKRSDKECCDAARASKGPEFVDAIKKNTAFTICCDGRPVACMFTKNDSGNAVLDGILDGCRMKHEEFQVKNHVDCDKRPLYIPRASNKFIGSGFSKVRKGVG